MKAAVDQHAIAPMTHSSTNQSTGPELVPAIGTHEPILANLLQLYAHDFSEFHDVEISEDGRFNYPQLPLYFSDPNRHPFLITLDSRLAGFVFVKKGSDFTGNPTAWDMAEFFILRAHRRRGLGTEIAHQVWSRFPGPWEVRVMHSNASAHEFWARAIAKFMGQPTHPIAIEKGGEQWHLFQFESETPAQR